MTQTYNLRLRQGQSETLSIRWLENAEPVDLSDWTATFQLRQTPFADEPLLAYTDGAGIVLGDDGTVVVTIPPADTRALEIAPGGERTAEGLTIWYHIGAYALKVTSPDSREIVLLTGKFMLDPEIVR